MPNTGVSPNMGITYPINLTDPAPDWGARIQAAFQTTIDQHDHSSGKGVQITPAGLNINADLAFGSKNATALRSVRFTTQGSPLNLGSDQGCLYVSGNELWYNDEGLHQVQLTNLGALNTAPLALVTKLVTTSYTILSTDTFRLFYYLSGTSATAIALPSAATVAQGTTYYIVDRDGNGAANPLTITVNGADTVNGINGSITQSQNYGLLILTTDGVSRWVANGVPMQPSAGTGNTALTTGTFTLSAATLKAAVLTFSGTLTGACTIVFPNSFGQYVCDFSQVAMGGNTIAVKSGSTTSANLAAANVGTTATTNQLSFVTCYGSNTIRVKA